MTEAPELVGPEYLATLLKRKVSTIKVDANRNPQSLPPRLIIPGKKRADMLWVKQDVIDWLNSLRPQIKRKVGRPSGQTNPAC
jgi:hypothetical protein